MINSPSEGFLQQLDAYEKALKAKRYGNCMTAARKEKIVADIRCGSKTIDQVMSEINATREEVSHWLYVSEKLGARGLKVTKCQGVRAILRGK